MIYTNKDYIYCRNFETSIELVRRVDGKYVRVPKEQVNMDSFSSEIFVPNDRVPSFDSRPLPTSLEGLRLSRKTQLEVHIKRKRKKRTSAKNKTKTKSKSRSKKLSRKTKSELDQKLSSLPKEQQEQILKTLRESGYVE